MIKKMILPLLKKFIGIFISMIFVSVLAISLLSGEASSIYNLSESYKEYKSDYKSMDIMISTDSFNRGDMDISNVEGIEEYIYRYTLDIYFGYTSEGYEKIIYSRIYTYNDEDPLIKRYSYSKGTFNEYYLNISLAKKFADLNHLKINDYIYFYINGIKIPANIYELVDAPETLYVSSNKYIWQDNKDFGYMYINHSELERIYNIYKDDYDLSLLADSFNGNQILASVRPGYKKEDVKKNLEEYIEEKGIKIKDSILESESPYEIYINNCVRQIKTAAIFLPVFFFSVTLVIILLFMNQIIKSMSKEIAIMISIGIKRIEIYGLFSIFILINTILSSILGNLIAIGITRYTTKIFMDVYSFPTISRTLDFKFVLLSIIAIFAIGQLACFISCRKILNMNVTYAINNNRLINNKESKLAKSLTKNRSISFSLAINSIFKNKKRFFVSLFSTFATISIVLAALQLNNSINHLLSHTIDLRLSYDCQIYSNEIYDDAFIEDISSKDFVEELEVCYFTYTKIEANNQEYYLKTMAIDSNSSLIYIPNNDNKRINVEESGIILSFNDANNLGVNIGDNVIINNKEVKVIDISRQYFNMTEYMSKNQMDALGIEYKSCLILNTNDEVSLLNYLVYENPNSLAVFSSSLKADLTSRFSSVYSIVIALIIFSLLIGLSILTIMSMNQLSDDKRNITIMRVIGFRIRDISLYFFIQEVFYIIISILLAVPFTLLLTKSLLGYVSTNRQIYPFIIDFKIILLSISFTLFTIVISHIISMLKVNKWKMV